MTKLVAVFACAAVLLLPSGASASLAKKPAAGSRKADSVPLFAGGGTAVTNGYFFPGTALYQNGEFIGTPLQVPQGDNIEFINTDAAAVTNAHQIVSMKRKRGKPLFQSPLVKGPATATVITETLKPGVYPYFCNVHYGMYGLIEITAP